MTNYPLLNLFWTMLEFFIWILWFFLLFKILADIFRSHDMSGWAKAGWIVLVIILPFIGVLAYVIIRGRSMGLRDQEQAQKADAAFKQYIRDAAAPPTEGVTASTGTRHVEELSKLADLKANGALTEDEFQKAKDKLLG
ncbi:SHOCT domain-containing protein [Streptacidiphilus albus]|uniref:SHOCT domain-containing protein n=1 Tax=Streptacidiphilus albus TaxID=105425 RepID=UPI00054C6572|nr:SHOCT domain-containing protein [Streptacidiphilus albus]